MDKFYDQLGESYQHLKDKLSGWMDDFILQIPNIVIALAVMIVAFFLAKYIKKATTKSVRKFTTNRTLINLSSYLSAALFGLLILFIVLSIFNLDGTVNKILATAGVLGLAIGLALQDPIKNLFSGVTMAVRKLYNVGDLVETNGYFGTITNIDLRATKIRLPAGQDVVIPNTDVIENPLTNFSSSGLRRVDVECGVSYGEDLDKVERIVRHTIRNMKNVLEDKGIDVLFTEYGGSSINFVARYWIVFGASNKDYLVEKSKGIKAIKAAFDENGIMIPYPIRTLDFGIKGGVALNEQLKVVSRKEDGISEEMDYKQENAS